MRPTASIYCMYEKEQIKIVVSPLNIAIKVNFLPVLQIDQTWKQE